MSNLQVDSISSMGGGHVDGAGLVVQYVETSDDYVATAIEISSTTFVSTGITLSFTPEFVGSKVCVGYTGSMASAPSTDALAISLYKDGVRITGQYGLGYLEGDGQTNSRPSFGSVGGQYIFTTTSLSTIVFTVYAKRPSGTGTAIAAYQHSSYTLSATEYAQ